MSYNLNKLASVNSLASLLFSMTKGLTMKYEIIFFQLRLEEQQPTCRIVSLASNVLRDKSHSQILKPSNLLPILKSLKIKPEACSDLLSTLRFFCHPTEKIVLNQGKDSLTDTSATSVPEFEVEIDKIVDNCYTFLTRHHFSLLEIYGAEFQDLIEDVPDPTMLPLKVRPYLYRKIYLTIRLTCQIYR